MNAPFKPAHSPFGGSVATRVLHCPASVRLVEKVPKNLRRSSAYAERGTACHAAMVRLIDETPRYGAGGASIAFVHPKATGGILLELSERK